MISKVFSKKENNLINGSITSTIFVIAFPLFLTYLLELIYNLYDTFVLSATGIGDAGSVVLFSQIKNLLSATGSALISGAFILINSYIGRNDKLKVRMVITQLLYIIISFCFFCGLIFIGFGKPFLKLLQTPSDMINSSYGYYIAIIISLMIGLFNSIYTHSLTVKGNTKKVLISNIILIFTKVILSSIVVFSPIFENVTSTYLAVCTIIAQTTMLIPAITSLVSKKSDTRIIKEKPHKKMIKKICKLSLPIILGGIVFNLTKVIINSMVVNSYGSYVLTFYGLEALFYGVCTKFILSIQDASSTMTGQAMGNNNIKRVISIHKRTLLLGFIFSVINIILFFITKRPLSLIAVGYDVEMANMLVDFMIVYSINCFIAPLLEIVIAYLNSLRITKPKFYSDLLRTVILRLPLLIYFIYYTDIGYTSLALVFSISNLLTFVIMFIASIIITIRLKKKVAIQNKLLLPSIVYN